jgi:hypothetical protein
MAKEIKFDVDARDLAQEEAWTSWLDAVKSDTGS